MAESPQGRPQIPSEPLKGPTPAERQRFYEFGAFRVDTGWRLRARDGRPVPVTPKVFDTLLALIENRGRVLEKDELLRLVWADTIVEESNLSQNVFTLRKALGEEPHEHRYIATVPRRGYRFVADVRETTGPPGPDPGRPPHPLRSLAVLPFAALGAGDGDEYLGLGMADALITRLGNIRKLRVRPTSAVRVFVGTAPDPVAAGRSLGTDMVLEGSIQRTGDRIRVTVQLVGVEAGAPVWGERFDERLTDIFAVEDSISMRLAAALAHAGLADCHTLLASAGYGEGPPRESPGRARAAAVRALEIDPERAEAHASLALVKFRLDWDWAAAEAEFRRSIQLNPGYASAHHFYGLFLSAMGRAEEAVASLQLAQELDPLSLIIGTALGRVFHFARQFDRAREQHLRTLDMDPDFAEARMNLGLAFAQMSMLDEAAVELRRAMAIAGRRPLMLAVLGYVEAVAGRRAEAERHLAELEGPARAGRIPAVFLAYPLIGLGEHDRAFEQLTRASTERSGLLVYLKVEPLFDRLRPDRRFDALLERMGLRDRR